jgi:outer membrane protein TolC
MKFKFLNYILIAPALVLLLGELKAQEKLSLAEASRLATENNAELKASGIEKEISKQERNVARSLFLPTVSVTGQVNHYFKRNPFFGFGSEETSDRIPYGRFGGEDHLGVAVTAVQPLYNPVAGPTTRQADLSTRRSEMELELTKVEVVSLVRQAYLQTLVLQERLKVEQESIRRNERVLRDARSLFFQGKAIRVDTLRAYTAIKNLEPQVLKLKYAIESSKLRLKTLTGIKSDDVILTDSLHLQGPLSLHDEREVYESALRDNPEFQLIKLRVEMSKQNISTANAARLPGLSAVGQYQLQSQTNGFEFGQSYYPSSSFVGIQVYVPLFAGFSLQSKSQAARLKRTQSEVREGYSHEQLKARVHDVVAQNHESQERLQTASSVRETAELSYKIIQYRYQKGIASRLELNDAEFELSSAKSNYLEAVYDYLSSEIEIAKLTGKID